MNWFEVRVRPLAPFRTQWRNDTVWGRLTWAVAQGVLPGWSIQRWLQGYREQQPPLVVGDGFPASSFPLPAAWKTLHAAEAEKPPEYITFAEFVRLASGGKPPIARGRPPADASRLHVSLSRETNTAAEGSLRVEQAYTTHAETGETPEPILIHTLTSQDLGQKELEALWQHLAMEGWGKRRSVGYGAFELIGITPAQTPQNGDAFLTLGHCLPTPDLPREGLWRWTGIEAIPHDPVSGLAILPKMFTLALRPGACFHQPPTREWTGRMLLHPLEKNQDYMKYGLAPCWPFRWPA